MTRVGLAEMIAAGPRAVGRYTGTLLSVFVMQSLVAATCMVAVATVFAQAFSHLPLWDDAVDGDLVALLYCLRHGKVSMLASSGIVLGAIAMWTLISWFIAGGINGVLAQRPEGRADTARAFGASGASTFLAYARIALCSFPSWLIVFVLLVVGLKQVAPRFEHALTVAQLLGPLFVALLPAMLVLHVAWTITDYARIELTLRQETHDPSAVMTYLRTAAYVLRRPRALAHGALGWLAFALVTLGYMYLAQGHPMYGAEGAVTLFVIRQGVALARMALRFGVLGGQLELAKTRPLPPRRVQVQAETKS